MSYDKYCKLKRFYRLRNFIVLADNEIGPPTIEAGNIINNIHDIFKYTLLYLAEAEPLDQELKEAERNIRHAVSFLCGSHFANYAWEEAKVKQ